MEDVKGMVDSGGECGVGDHEDGDEGSRNARTVI